MNNYWTKIILFILVFSLKGSLANSFTCVDLFSSNSKSQSILDNLRKITGLDMSPQTGHNPKLSMKLFLEMTYLNEDKLQLLLEFVRANYPSVVKLKESDSVAKALKRIFDLVIVKFNSAESFF